MADEERFELDDLVRAWDGGVGRPRCSPLPGEQAEPKKGKTPSGKTTRPGPARKKPPPGDRDPVAALAAEEEGVA